MLRKVVNTETSRAQCNLLANTPDAFSIRDTLECGHTTYRKGSAGFAMRRQCIHCDNLKGGGVAIRGDTHDNIADQFKRATAGPVSSDGEGQTE